MPARLTREFIQSRIDMELSMVTFSTTKISSTAPTQTQEHLSLAKRGLRQAQVHFGNFAFEMSWKLKCCP